MTTATPELVREAISDAVETTGLSCSPYALDTINPPCAHVIPGEYDPRMVFSGETAMRPFIVRAFYPRYATVSQQQQLDELRDPTGAVSVMAAVQDEANWGSVDIDYVQVVNVGGNVEREVGGDIYLTCDFDIEVVW